MVRGLNDLDWVCSSCDNPVQTSLHEESIDVRTADTVTVAEIWNVDKSFAIPEAPAEESICTAAPIEETSEELRTTYDIVEGGTKRGKRKLVDNLGFSYTIQVLILNNLTIHKLYR